MNSKLQIEILSDTVEIDGSGGAVLWTLSPVAAYEWPSAGRSS